MKIFTTLEINAKTPTLISPHTDKIPVPVGEDSNQYFQAAEMNTFNEKINSNTADVKSLMENSNEINQELLKRIRIISFPNVLPGQTVNFPSAQKNDAFIIEIVNSDGVVQPNSSIRLGGYSGISVGHNTLVLAKNNSAGGTFADVGHDFLLINQKVETVVSRVDHFSDLQYPGNLNFIYLVNDTGKTYYWNVDITPNDYVEYGNVVEGTIINSTTFHDLSDTPVTPDGTKLYLDVGEGVYYRYNGAEFIPINFSNTNNSLTWSQSDW